MVIKKLATAAFFYRAVQKQRAFIAAHLTDKITSYLNQDQTVQEEDIQKIIQYYGWTIPVVLGEGYALLRGSDLTHKERLALTYLGACIGLFDDFYDEHHLPHEHIEAMLLRPQKVNTHKANERLFLYLYQEGLQHVKEPEVLKAWFLKIAEAQVMSQGQAEVGMSRDELIEVTEMKGAYSVLFYRHVFDTPPGETEVALLYRLGAIAQLEDDIFDTWKDYQEGIRTVPNTSLDVDRVRYLYRQWNGLATQLAYAIPYPPAQIEKFLNFHYFIYARGLVCLDQFKKAQKNYRQVFDPAIMTREELICDMESWRNRLRLMGYLARY